MLGPLIFYELVMLYVRNVQFSLQCPRIVEPMS